MKLHCKENGTAEGPSGHNSTAWQGAHTARCNGWRDCGPGLGELRRKARQDESAVVMLLTAVLVRNLKRLIESTRVAAQRCEHGVALDAGVALEDVAVRGCPGRVDAGHVWVLLPRDEVSGTSQPVLPIHQDTRLRGCEVKVGQIGPDAMELLVSRVHGGG